jgi:hypothetical protein
MWNGPFWFLGFIFKPEDGGDMFLRREYNFNGLHNTMLWRKNLYNHSCGKLKSCEKNLVPLPEIEIFFCRSPSLYRRLANLPSNNAGFY